MHRNQLLRSDPDRQFDSLDNDLDEITFLEAQQDRLLVFVGNEILSGWGAQLVAALGGETDFKLRAWFVRSGLRSLNYDEVTVRKV